MYDPVCDDSSNTTLKTFLVSSRAHPLRLQLAPLLVLSSWSVRENNTVVVEVVGIILSYTVRILRGVDPTRAFA